ncbi:MAG: plasminogen-binding N-terminal domain-containing protein [Campylobacterota bacterium]|nr:plasminogen-binding N-terminal domain-containing protein [Campylobacterota bacterium]
MKFIFLTLFMLSSLVAAVIKAPILSIDEEKQQASVTLERVDVGVSGFLVHTIVEGHTSILKNVHVVKYDKESKVATLQMSEFNALANNALPTGKWQAKVGDKVELAFGYSRALLVAPSEEIYHQITKSVKVQWVHVDIFATILSYRGHPTPLKEDFDAMNIASSVGLLFIYLDKKLYTIDIKSFAILNISEAPLVQDSVKLPFYSRVETIEANWWGEGSDELEDYEPHYYALLVENNKKNRKLYEIIKNGDAKNHFLLENFEIGE